MTLEENDFGNFAQVPGIFRAPVTTSLENDISCEGDPDFLLKVKFKCKL
jgi:hypothetical protein